jgi:hypothetical protein
MVLFPEETEVIKDTPLGEEEDRKLKLDGLIDGMGIPSEKEESPELDNIVDSMDESSLKSVMSSASRENPDKFSEAVKTSNTTGIPVDAALDDPEEAAAQSIFDVIDFDKIADESMMMLIH